MSQDEITRLLEQAKGLTATDPAAAGGPGEASAPPANPPASVREAKPHGPAAVEAAAPPPPAEADIAPHDIDYLLTQAERALESVNALHTAGLPAGIAPTPWKNSAAARRPRRPQRWTWCATWNWT